MLDFLLTCDANWETRVDKLVSLFDNNTISVLFEQKNYGNSVAKIAVILMCRNPELAFKQRIRFSKAERILSIDIMLEYNLFMHAGIEEKQKIVAEKLLAEVPPIVAKYKFKDFNGLAFENDLQYYLRKIKWITF